MKLQHLVSYKRVSYKKKQRVFRRISAKDEDEAVLFHQHLGLHLDEKLTFTDNLTEKICRANTEIGLLKKLYYYLHRTSLLDIYKSFIKPHLDYGVIIYDQPQNDALCRMIESLQYNTDGLLPG